MNSLTLRALVAVARRAVFFSALIFLAAWSWNFVEAWVFLIVFFIPELLTVVYLLQKKPGLLERRLKGGSSAEHRPRQKTIMKLASISFVSLLLVAGFDHRFNWSHFPTFFVIAADSIILLGFIINFRVLKENAFAVAVVEISEEQKVISSGPYAKVRHPMYAGALLLNFCIPVALGSWWGFPFALVNLGVIVLRLLDEESLLRQSLPGYESYCRKVPYRLVPRVW
jgi:protein-S-isoprenylcysteine O-methyltransferase Ste14